MSTNYNSYEKMLHKILKTYNSILVNSKNIPNLSDKNIIMVEDIDSMINAQIEARKPIIYYQEAHSISLILLDSTEAYIYILKENNRIMTEVENVINNIDIAKNTFVKEILKKIEKMLLNGSINQENLFTTSELQLLNNVNNQIKENKLNEDELENATREKSIKSRDNEQDKYLVPVKKRKSSFFDFFNKNKKRKYGRHC